METLTSYVLGEWRAGDGAATALFNPTTEETIGQVRHGGYDPARVLAFARETGGTALRAMTFGERAAALKALSKAIYSKRDELLDLSIRAAGTTRGDAKFDIDGATGTLAAYAAYGEALGSRRWLVDGDGVQLGRTPRFWGEHVLMPRLGAAFHVNAFNFPAWNMLEKAACALLAGTPVIEKPGTPTAMVAWRIAQIIAESGVLPKGAFQLVVGSASAFLDHLNSQDSIAFTGSSATAALLRGNANVVRKNVRVNLEADSLNAAVLGPDVEIGAESFGLFRSNVTLDMTQKTGQKCTAVRRILVPKDRIADVRDELAAILADTRVGDPALNETRMGPLASKQQLDDVRAGIARLEKECEVATGGSATAVGGAKAIQQKGYFVAPTLCVARDGRASVVHDHEVFGPVATIVPYSGDASEAASLVALGGGGLVASVYSDDPAWTQTLVSGIAPWSGRVWIGSEKLADQGTAPGTVLPASIHGGPGRAGGGEELGGLRGLEFYLQRTALQGYQGFVQSVFAPKA